LKAWALTRHRLSWYTMYRTCTQRPPGGARHAYFSWLQTQTGAQRARQLAQIPGKGSAEALPAPADVGPMLTSMQLPSPLTTEAKVVARTASGASLYAATSCSMTCAMHPEDGH
jgi:hypothetical protein